MEILREQYLDYMTFRHVERPLFVELFGPLVGLEEEWRAQGASEAEIDMTAFGFDYVRRQGVHVRTGMMGGFEEVTLEETPEYVIRRDEYGRTVKMFRTSSTIAHPLDFPVHDMDSWLKVKHWYTYREDRFVPGWAEAARRARADGALIVVGMPGGFDTPRQLMGEAATCMAYYDQPELMHDILDTVGETAERVLDRVSQEVQVDQLSVHEDLAGKSGSMVGPRQIEGFIAPYYHRIWDMLSARGAQIFQQDSDGNVNAVIPAFLDAGLTCMFPMEPAAGMDVVQLRETYGQRLAMLGGIDKHVLRQDLAAIRAELEYKLQPMMRQGGMVFGLDHRIPNGTPLAHYRYYVRTAREILGLDPDPEPGWARMAF
ncbi:MAG: uroporphyrinogen decarboxylase family protein [Anaerolineae bacterium]